MKNSLLTALLIVSWTCFGQNINFKVEKSRLFSEIYERTTLIKKIPDGKGGTFTIRKYNEHIPNTGPTKISKGFLVQHWDNKNKSLSYKNHEIEIDKKGYISSIFLNDEKLHIIEYVKNKKDKTIDCFAHIPLSDKTSFERKKIFSVSVEKFPGFLATALSNNIDNDYEGNVSFSPDKKKIVFNIDSYEKEQEKHKILVFNNNLEPIWQKDFTHNSKDKLFDLNQLEVDNIGSIFILAKVFNSTRSMKKKDNVNYHFEVFKVTQKDTESINLNTSDNFIKTLELNIKNDKLNCIGFFSTESDYKLIGVSFFSIDKQSMGLINSNFQKFPSKFMSDKYGLEDNLKELENYSIDNIINTDDGGYIITGEEFYITNYNNGTTSYNFDDIIVLRLSKSGELLWSRNINKKQSGSYLNRALSYSALFKNNNVYLFFNAHKKMGKLSENRELFKAGLFGNINKQNSNLYVISFDEKGSWDSSIIQQNKTSDVLFKMYHSEINNTNDSKIVLFGSKEKKKQFLFVDILD